MKKDKLYILDIAAVGDRVEFLLNEDNSGVIETIGERKNYLSRKFPKVKGTSFRGERLEQIIAANLDNVVIINSLLRPNFNNKTLDRILTSVESSHLNALIVINKTDLDKKSLAEKWGDLYRSIGYKVLTTSCVDKTGFDEFHDLLRGRTSLFWGSSGVGKSSILNELYPGLDLKVGNISDYSNKGRHTTVTVNMRKVEDNTFIIDTPGLREIEPFGIKKEDLGHFFPDFVPFLNNCKFNSCTHSHEPDCSVIEAVGEGNINEERYLSYLNLLETVEEDIIF